MIRVENISLYKHCLSSLNAEIYVLGTDGANRDVVRYKTCVKKAKGQRNLVM